MSHDEHRVAVTDLKFPRHTLVSLLVFVVCWEVLSHLAPVAQAMFARLAPVEKEEASPDIGVSLADFEKWYGETHDQPFWVLFEHYIPETPRVDF